MLQSRWAKFLKMVFVFNNFIFLLIGLVAVGFGLWGIIQGEKVFGLDWFPKITDEVMQQELQRNVKHAFTWLIIGAVILVGIAFLGFCGGCKENRCILGVFFVILFVLTLVFFTALILFYAFPSLVGKGLDKVFHQEKDKYLEDLGNNATSDFIRSVDTMQEKLKCCLVNETVAVDYKIKSCFEKWGDSDVKSPDAVFHGEGCAEATIDAVKGMLKAEQTTFALIVVITIIVCVVQMILSLYICCKIKSQTYETMT